MSAESHLQSVTRTAQVAPRERSRDAGALRRMVVAAAGGDQRAWSTLVVRFDSMVRGVARSYRLSEADVDDVAQETWTRFLRGIGQVEEPAAVAGWLVTTTRREALRALQRGTREVLSADVPEADEPVVADPTDALAAAQRRTALAQAVARLPTHQRVLIETLIRDDSASYCAVAERLCVPVGSVGPTRGRALARLRHDPALVAAACG